MTSNQTPQIVVVKEEKFLSDLNEEKRSIIKTAGNVLVTANPGTGKTKLLAYKYASLLKQEINPEDILCLTFTKKAKIELQDRILKILKEQNIKTDISKLNVFTFHSYALENIQENKIVSNNLLRYAIYQFFKDNEILNYGDSYLIETIVPKMENLIRYLKSFGIMPNNIDLEKTKKFLEGTDKMEKKDLDKFAEHFIAIFQHYEEIKQKNGIDYNDLLIDFLKIKETKKYKYVMVDELQDVNNMEADMALKCAESYIAVGDKKQAIFGFQGGSIINFQKFQLAKPFVLSENFRSSNEVLKYSREHFNLKTKDISHKTDLQNLSNPESKSGVKPIVYGIAEKDDAYPIICELAKQIKPALGEKAQLAIIARTNGQIMKISKELKKRGIDHSSTYFSSSDEARADIIRFLKGALSNDIQAIKNSMFTPFFPISVQDAFDIAEKKEVTIEIIFEKCPEFKKLRGNLKNFQDLQIIFEERIIPLAVTYGKAYLLGALNMQEAYQEAVKVIDNIDLKNLIDYLESADSLEDESDSQKDIVVTTVHKAKGMEFKYVIYAPVKPKDNRNFADNIAEAILKSKEIKVDEELKEEALRIDFVAFTRAEEHLCIITDKEGEYLNDMAEKGTINVESIDNSSTNERGLKAYNLFVSGEYDKAKALIRNDKSWLIEYIRDYFKTLHHLSFTSATNKAYEYLVDKILGIKESSLAMTLGSKVHNLAENLSIGKITEVTEELIPYKKNIETILKDVKELYPEVVAAEKNVLLPMSKLIDTEDDILFNGKIDLILKNKDNEYLILDWKTDKKTDNSAKHKQQLETYKRAFSIESNVPMDKIKTGIGFIGLKNIINDGKVYCEYDNKQPGKTAFTTISNKIKRMLEWRANPDSFFQDLLEENCQDDALWRAIVEQYKAEKK